MVADTEYSAIARRGSQPETARRDGRRQGILLVEDEVLIAMAESRILKSAGYSVVTASNGDDAVKAVEDSSQRIDLVLMDLDLGAGMDGVVTAQAILSRRDLPIVFLSSHDEKDFLDRIEAITSYGYIVKGSADRILFASIKMALKLYHAHQELDEWMRAVEHAEWGIALGTSDGALIEIANPAFERMHGFSHGAMRGMSVLELFAPAYRAELEARLAKMRETGRESWETIHLRKDGTQFPAFVAFNTVKDAAGSLLSCVVNTQDITTRVQDCESLARQEKQLRLRLWELNCVHDVSKILDEGGGEFSHRLQAIADLLPKSWQYPESACARISLEALELRSERFVESPWKLSSAISLRGRNVGSIEVCYRDPVSPAGEDCFLSEERVLLDLVARRVALSLERKQSEEAINERESRYRRITERMTDYIYMVRFDSAGAALTTHGLGCLAVTGYSTDELNGAPYLWLDMVPREERALVLKQASLLRSGLQPDPIEHRIVRKDGSVRWVRDTPVTMLDSLGGLRGYDGLIQDVTERKNAELALAEAIAEAERLRARIESISDAEIKGGATASLARDPSSTESATGTSGGQR